jgi:hypothetical protein
MVGVSLAFTLAEAARPVEHGRFCPISPSLRQFRSPFPSRKRRAAALPVGESATLRRKIIDNAVAAFVG